MDHTRKTRVAVTGIGMVSPLGHDSQSTWDALMARKSGIDYIKRFDASKFPTQIAAEVKNFDLSHLNIDAKLLRCTSLFTRFALKASIEAITDAGIKPTASTASRWGTVLGSGMITAEYDYWEDFHKEFAATGEIDMQKLGAWGSRQTSPSSFASMQVNSGLGILAKYHNIQGYCTSVHTACASGGQALGLAMQAIRRGDADYILAGGYDSMINPMGIAGFSLLGAMSTMNEDPSSASRPFDLTRNGFILGEGAAFLILENWDKAKGRGAKIYAELAGEGNSLSSYRITDSHPSGDGAIQAIESALKDATVEKSQVDYINAHGTSTKMNDFSETNAIKAVFKERAKAIPMSSIKSQMGHLISAAGAIEGAISVLAIQNKRIPMTMNLNTPDPECDLDYVTEGPRDKTLGVVLSNSFGFGGSNSSIIFKHPDL